jgi:hypothetical protein
VKQKVKVDTTPPEVLSSFSINPMEKKVEFIFDIQELNFKEITYQDKTNFDGFRTLCSSLINGRCRAVRPFANGQHFLDIIVTDKAGNSAAIVSDYPFEIPA